LTFSLLEEDFVDEEVEASVEIYGGKGKEG
jgi:hypothetical protein